MQNLSKVIEIEAVVGFDGDSPYTYERDVHFTTEGDRGYIKLPSDMLLDRQSLKYLTEQLEIFQRQIDAGKETE